MQSPFRRHVPRWVAVCVPLILVGGVLCCVVFYWPWITRPRVGPSQGSLPASLEGGTEPSEFLEFQDRFLGHTEADVLARFGPPNETLRADGPHTALFDVRKYPEAHTAVYTQKGGRLYLSFCKQRGRWVCFAAVWQPLGWVF